MLRQALRYLAMERGRAYGLWTAVCTPDMWEHAEWWRRHGGLHAIGERVGIVLGAKITDPPLTRIGSDVVISVCTLIGHDGSIGIVNRAANVRVDSIGPVTICDLVFVGEGALVMPGVTIGPRAIVAAGAVVTRDVPENSVVAGNPARVLRSFDEHVATLVARTSALPWAELIEEREGAYDPALEPELTRRRVTHFFGGE